MPASHTKIRVSAPGFAGTGDVSHSMNEVPSVALTSRLEVATGIEE